MIKQFQNVGYSTFYSHTPNRPSTKFACTFARNQEIDFTSAINKKMRMVESLSDRLKLHCWSLWKST